MPNTNGKTPQPPDPSPLAAASAEQARGVLELLDTVEGWANGVLSGSHRARPRHPLYRRTYRETERAAAEVLLALAQVLRRELSN